MPVSSDEMEGGIIGSDEAGKREEAADNGRFMAIPLFFRLLLIMKNHLK